VSEESEEGHSVPLISLPILVYPLGEIQDGDVLSGKCGCGTAQLHHVGGVDLFRCRRNGKLSRCQHRIAA
jgi:hypothetical protein